jgi:hypothetical protein
MAFVWRVLYERPPSLLDVQAYAQRVTAMDMCAHGFTRDFVAEYRRCVRPLRDDQLAWLAVLSREAAGRLRRLGVRDGVPWRFARFCPPVAANALPHTLGRTILLGDAFFDGLRSAPDAGVATLVHEKIHVLQRARPQFAHDYVTRVLGYRRLARVDAEMRRALRMRANPDVDDYVYALGAAPGFAWQAYRSARPSSLRDSTLRGDAAYEHPFEHMAYSLAERA